MPTPSEPMVGRITRGGSNKVFWRNSRGRSLKSHTRTRRTSLSYRTERRRQVDSVRLAIGSASTQCGSIVFKGEDITNLRPFQRVRKGLCQKFQTTRIYRAFTVAQNLMIAERTPRWSWRKNGRRKNGILNWALPTLGLDLVGEVPAGKLSHSHQQWLEICLALATEPNLLLLDEPTAGMTPEETELTAQFVVNLNQQGLTVLVVEHDMAFVRYIAQGVTVLHYGRIFAEGSLDEIESNQEVRRIYLGEH